ncbi:MAG: hypothetical protein FVQ80_12930 [Planctomycetes bacterium]|nr:hypothetical protein [Planctomycetota bacterium]
MINNFRVLGKSVLLEAGYYDTADEAKRREIFLKNQTIKTTAPSGNDEQTKRAIAINFNTKNKTISFTLDKEITEENRDYFFALKHGASKDERKFLSTNCPRIGGNPHFGKTITESINYIANKRSKKEISNWFAKNIDVNFDNILNHIKDTFLKTVKIDNNEFSILDENLLIKEQRQIFKEVKGINLKDLKKLKNKKKIYDKLAEAHNYVINRKYFNNSSSVPNKFPDIALIKIDDKHILEIKDLRDSYLNMAYYDLFERFFIEKSKENRVCHICHNIANVLGEVSLPMKFYGTTNTLYLENLKKANAYKSFSICKECLAQVLTGMKYVENELRDSLFGISCYLVPSLEKEENNFETRYKRIFRLLKNNTSYKEDIDEIYNLVRKSGKKDNFTFNLLFYDSPPGSQVFNIIKLISNIEYKDLTKKLNLFEEFRKDYKLSLLSQNITLNDVRYLLFPSKYSHSNYDAKLYRKDILDLFEAFIHEYSLNYHDLIHRFINIYRHRFNNTNTNIDQLAPFRMVLILSIFYAIKPLKGGKDMNGGRGLTDIINKEYKRFFNTHNDVYVDNYFRQGLFLLGTIINKIVNKQRKSKEGDSDAGRRKKLSSTFLKKLNYDGIPPRRVGKFIAETKNFVQIYDIYEEPGIWGNIMDRLQGIEMSDMKGAEVVFYILTGISYDAYLGMLYGKEKNNGSNKEE